MMASAANARATTSSILNPAGASDSCGSSMGPIDPQRSPAGKYRPSQPGISTHTAKSGNSVRLSTALAAAKRSGFPISRPSHRAKKLRLPPVYVPVKGPASFQVSSPSTRPS